MKAFRRGLLVVGFAIAAGIGARVFGKGNVEAQSGGWRELQGDEFR